MWKLIIILYRAPELMGLSCRHHQQPVKIASCQLCVETFLEKKQYIAKYATMVIKE